MTATSLLITSLVILSGLFSLKAWELSYGKTPWARLRDTLDRTCARFLARVLHASETFLQKRLRILIRKSLTSVHFAFTHARNWVEMKLINALKVLQKRERARRRDTSSSFLKDISAHKDTLRKK